ncbi:MAG: hypothetical protein HDT43_08980 [Ruminococcaceae bacterium]|nr:hypothetical protein [Oscillospiraceae bacterium]
MRIFLNETAKIFLKKSTLGLLLALAILNGVLLWVNESNNSEYYAPQQYKAVYENLEGMSAEEACEFLNSKSELLELIFGLLFGNLNDVSDENIDIEELQKIYENGEYLTYTNNFFAEKQLLSAVLNEVGQCADYENYLQKIDSEAEKMQSISLFSDPNTFGYKNAVRTPRDFSHLKGSVLQVAPSRGVEMATDFLVTDLLVFVFIVAAVVSIVTREKELGQIILTRTAKNGRAALGISKLFACFFTALVGGIILWSVNFAAAGFTYGFGDITRQIQSAYGFGGGNLKISVAQFFALFLFAKLFVYFILAAFSYLLAVVINNSPILFGALIAFLGAEGALYYSIDDASFFSPLKYINLISYAKTDKYFSRYLNLNFFGQPVNVMPIFAITAGFFFVLFSAAAVVAFSKRSAIKTSRTRLPRANLFAGRTTKIFPHECYKIFIGEKALFILFAFFALTMLFYKPMRESFRDMDAVYYKQYMLELEGEFNGEKQQYLLEKQAEFENIEREMQNADGYGIMRYQKLLAPKNAFEKVLEHAEYLKTTDVGEFLYDSGYELLTGGSGNTDVLLALLAMTMTLICLAGAYSAEYQTCANVLLNSTPNGRGRTFRAKFFIGIIIISAIFLITYAPYFYNVLNAYGVRGINAPACSMETLSDRNISIFQYLILLSAKRYLAMILAMLIIFFISTKLKSRVATLLAGASVLILPILITLLGVDVFKYVLLDPFIIGNV